MRSFGGRQPSREKSDYRRGYEKGLAHMLITFVVFVLGFRALVWASRHDVVGALIEWLTTPQIKPATLLGGLFFAVLAWVVLGTLISVGRFSA